jgi:catechol 2,3-dioxygenase-like lactoylglutathione lyase family enzyme
MEKRFDRTAEDLGNIVALEHVNVVVPDQQIATLFYVSGMGLTRDPYLMTGVDNMWINVGRSQFHLPTGQPQVLRGHVGLVLPDRDALLMRLTEVKANLDNTQFAFVEHDTFVEVTSPWGNRLRCFEPDPHFGRIILGMPYVEFDVPVGTSAAIAHFYREILGADCKADKDERGNFASCSVGHHQNFIYRETDRPLPSYDGHHVQIYLADFSGPHAKLKARGLLSEDANQWLYRFKDIVDPDAGKVLFTIEHEIRSMTHPLFARSLVNRNPEQRLGKFAAGHDELRWVPAFDD